MTVIVMSRTEIERMDVLRPSAIWGDIVPDVPVPFRIFAEGAALYKPGMLVGSVVGHEIEQNLDAACMAHLSSFARNRPVLRPRLFQLATLICPL
jgi:hypothetical protein